MTDIEAAITQLLGIGQAIADAEAELAAAERKVAALRAVRDDLQPFIARYQSILSSDGNASVAAIDDQSVVGSVVRVFQDRPGAVLDASYVFDLIKTRRADASLQSVRNALAYARRLGLLRMERRGWFTAAETASPNQEERPHDEL